MKWNDGGGKIWKDNKWNASAHYRLKVFLMPYLHNNNIVTTQRESERERQRQIEFFYSLFIVLHSTRRRRHARKTNKNDKILYAVSIVNCARNFMKNFMTCEIISDTQSGISVKLWKLISLCSQIWWKIAFGDLIMNFLWAQLILERF